MRRPFKTPEEKALTRAENRAFFLSHGNEDNPMIDGMIRPSVAMRIAVSQNNLPRQKAIIDAWDAAHPKRNQNLFTEALSIIGTVAAVYFGGSALMSGFAEAGAGAGAADAATVETSAYVAADAPIGVPIAESAAGSTPMGALTVPSESAQWAGGYTGLVRDSAGNVVGGFTGANPTFAAETSFINTSGYSMAEPASAISLTSTLKNISTAKSLMQLASPAAPQRSSVPAGTTQNLIFGGNMETPQGTPMNPGAAPQNVVPNPQAGSTSPLMMLLAGAVALYFASKG